MFLHRHPYPPFVPARTTKLIVGTLPPPRFSTGDLYPDDVNFCYGSKYGLLWPILEKVFNQPLEYQNTEKAVLQRKELLEKNHIGICDIVEYCRRDVVNASDLGMEDIHFRDLLKILGQYPAINTLLFTGGNSKNGPEYLFRKYLKLNGLKLTKSPDLFIRTHYFYYKTRKIKTLSLISPSSAANRSVGANPEYKKIKIRQPGFTTFDFRVQQYSKVF